MSDATGTGVLDPADLEGAAPDSSPNGVPEEEGEDKARGTKPPPIELSGADQLTFDIGGEPPDSASIRLVGGKVGLRDRQYEKGEIVELTVRARVAEVGFVDTHDVDGNVIGTERRHKARVISAVEN